MGVLTELWVLEQMKNRIFRYTTITGGIIKIFQIVNNTISRIMLKILRKLIINQSNIVREEKIQQIKSVVNLKNHIELETIS